MGAILGIALTIMAWFGTKAAPAVFKYKQDKEQKQIELAKDLCDNHNDCEAEKAIAMKGLKKKHANKY